MVRAARPSPSSQDSWAALWLLARRIMMRRRGLIEVNDLDHDGSLVVNLLRRSRASKPAVQDLLRRHERYPLVAGVQQFDQLAEGLLTVRPGERAQLGDCLARPAGIAAHALLEVSQFPSRRSPHFSATSLRRRSSFPGRHNEQGGCYFPLYASSRRTVADCRK
jgi:hypothetical protein